MTFSEGIYNMENYNQNAFYALKLLENGYATVGSIPNLSLCGTDEFSITTQFYAKATNGRIPLIMQSGAFEFGMDSRNAYYNATGIGSHMVTNDEFKLDAGRWNTLGVTYDGSTIRIYVNGIKALETGKTANRTISSSDIKIGGNFNGYVKYTRVYGKVLTDSEIGADRTSPQMPVEQMELCLDFSTSTPEDKGKYSKPITLNGNEAERRTALRVTDAGVAKPLTSSRVNNVLGTGSFTILSKIKPSYIGGNTQPMLFSNAKTNSSRVAILFYQGDSYPNRAHASLKMGTLQYGGGTDMPYDEWTNLSLVYNRTNNKAYYYVNGVLGCEYNIQSRPTLSAEDICIGSRKETYNGPFGGLIDSICVFNSALDSNALVNYAHDMPDQTAPGLAAYYSFNAGEAKDIISGEAITLTEGARLEDLTSRAPIFRCTPVNLVNTLYPGTAGAALPESNVKVADQLAQGDTTILTKVYPKRPTPEEGIVYDKYWNIFTIAPYGNASSMNLVMRHDPYMNKAAISVEAPNAICSCERVDYDQWVDVALIYRRSQSKIEVYVNGVLKNTFNNIQAITKSEFALHLGNGIDMVRPYHGYIDYIAVFDGAVQPDRLQSYILEPPVFIEQDLTALYTFNSEELREQVSGTVVNLVGDAAVILAEDTQTQAGKKECPEFPDNHTGTEYELWQANTVASIYIKFIHENYGLWPTGGFKDEECTQLLGSVANYIEKSVLIYDEVQMVLAEQAEHEEMDPETIKAMIQVLANTGKAAMLNRFFYACIDAHTRENIEKDLKDLIIKIVIGVVIAVVLVVIISAVIAWFKPIAPPPPPPSPPSPPSPNPDPDDLDDDDDEKKYHIVSIDSITFCHTPSNHAASAIQIRDVQTPEWVNGRNSKNNPSQSAYISSSVTASAYINVRFRYQTNDNDSYTAKIKGESKSGNKPLGSLDTVSISMRGNNTYYTARFSLNHNGMASLLAGSFTDEIKWSNTTELLTYRNLGNTYHTIHLLANEPKAPWGANAGDGVSLPTMNALNTWNDMLKYAEGSKSNTKEYFAAAATKWLHNSGKFVYADADQLSILSEQDSLSFARDTFDNRASSQSSGIQISPLDASLIIADSARLQGFDELGVAKLMSNNSITVLETDCSTGGTIKESDILLPLSIREVAKVGSNTFEKPSDIDAHFVCSNKGFDSEIYVYDGAYRLHDRSGQNVVCSNCRYAAEIYPYVDRTGNGYREMLLEADSVCPVIYYLMDWSNNLAKVGPGNGTKARLDGVKIKLFGKNFDIDRPGFTNDILNAMGRCIVHSISFGWIKDALKYVLQSQQNPIDYLQDIARIVLASNQIDRDIDNLIQNLDDSLTAASSREETFACLKALATRLNSVLANLRVPTGNFCWNSVIGENYDPEKWYYIKKPQSGGAQFEIESSYRGLNDNENYDDNQLILNNLPGEGFYILNDFHRDGDRLNLLLARGYATTFYIAQAQNNNQMAHIMGSSSNNYYPPLRMSDTDASAFYQYGGNWIPLW